MSAPNNYAQLAKFIASALLAAERSFLEFWRRINLDQNHVCSNLIDTQISFPFSWSNRHFY